MPMQHAAILSGRLFVRNLPAGCAAVVGVLRFGPEMMITEGQARTALFVGARLCIGDEIPEHVVEACSPYGITEMLELPIWPRSAVTGGLLLRFAAAHSQRNEWRVFAAASRQWVHGSDPEQCDFWFDVRAGEVTAIDSPCDDTRGSKPGQLLVRPVWPSASGRHFGYPQTLSGLWPATDALHALLADLADGAITESELREHVNGDVYLKATGLFSFLDLDYARYLAALRRLGGLALTGPFTQEEERDRRALSHAAIEAVHAAGNCSQL